MVVMVLYQGGHHNVGKMMAWLTLWHLKLPMLCLTHRETAVMYVLRQSVALCGITNRYRNLVHLEQPRSIGLFELALHLGDLEDGLL